MYFAVNKTTNDTRLDHYADKVTWVFRKNGHKLTGTEDTINFVLNLTDVDAPRHYKRKAQDEFVVSLFILKEKTEDIKSACFLTLVRTLSNLVIGIVPNGHVKIPDAYYITPEVGFVKFSFEPSRIYKCMMPIVGSHFVLRNRLKVDLPHSSLIRTNEIDDLIGYAHQLGRLGHLPVPFPLEDFLDKEKISHLFRMYEIKGLSYGNLSVRNNTPGMDGNTFWMTARGSDKAHLKQVGQDILLVTGYDDENHQMKVSVPPDYDPRVRVSVDAIEHFLIYSEFPRVGAIVHIHAWMDGIVCTTQNYPCGTYELAKSVAELLKETKNPDQAVVGLKNHGITITGLNLDEIFNRIKDRVQTSVPMFE